MNILIRTWTSNKNRNTLINPKKGLRYNAGSWIAEILDNQWTSYDIIKQIKLSDSQMEEHLLQHSSPRLPRDSFGVEEFLYSPSSPQVFQLEDWTVQQQVQKVDELKQALEEKQDLHLPLPQLSQPCVQLIQPVEMNHPQQKPKKVNKLKKKKNTTSLPSSSQTSHEQHQQQGPTKQVKRVPQQIAIVSSPLPIQQWKPLMTLQHQVPIVSFENPRDSSIYLPQQPKSQTKKQVKKHPIVCGSLAVEQRPSICRIQD